MTFTYYGLYKEMSSTVVSEMAAQFHRSYFDKARYVLQFIYQNCWFGTNAEFFGADNAYEVHGVRENSSFEEIKASFRKLAKETHPDLADSNTADSKHFIQILAAYEVLLFEPRCSAHDIGGWYVKTYGRDRKRKTVPSQRYWDGFNAHQECEEKLHPAVYLLALAYRTLDIENVRHTKQTLWDIAQGNLSKMLHWCKKLV